MVNQDVYDELLEKFGAHYGVAPTVVSYAPGRIEVLGNHTDYNEGYVFSAAIDYGTFFAVRPNDLGKNRIVAGDLMHEVVFPLVGATPVKEDTWANYVIGTVAGIEADAVTLAKIGQRAEHDYAGCSCGLLDQISSLCGAQGKLVKTDFRTLKVETVDLGPTVCFLMCNPHAKHALVDGQYNSRRQACEEAAAYFAKVLPHPVTALRDVSWAEWEAHKAGLDPTVAARAAHPIGEDERGLEGATLLEKGDLEGFGSLLNASHKSSQVYFENSHPEIDRVVAIAQATPGVLGARISGGGFGGSAVVLVRADQAEAARAAIAEGYKAQTGKPCDVARITPSQGATVVFRAE